MNRVEKKFYPGWLAFPGLLVYIIIFVIPTFASFYFSMTTWNLKTAVFTGTQNFVTFFTMTSTRSALLNTLVYAFATCALKLTLGLLLANYICSGIRSGSYLKLMVYFPTLLGNVAVGIAFQSILAPEGVVNQALAGAGFEAVRWLTDARYALPTCIVIDVWRGIGTATLIYIAGLCAIPKTYYEAAALDGVQGCQCFFKITLPLMVPSINSVLTLALIGGLRTYELIYTMTGGGPGYSTEVLGSVIYKLFARGSYGLATAGYVILFVLVSCIVYPLNSFVTKKEVDL